MAQKSPKFTVIAAKGWQYAMSTRHDGNDHKKYRDATRKYRGDSEGARVFADSHDDIVGFTMNLTQNTLYFHTEIDSERVKASRPCLLYMKC